jgi:hypothetical protein
MIYHEDNCKGWLEVPITKLEELDIEREISTFSYMDEEKGLAYLVNGRSAYSANDKSSYSCDMQLFLEHYPDLELSELESVESERSFIRDLERYKW